jgi:hypothetical protein
MNLKIRAILAGVILACLSPTAARAACGTIPSVFVNSVSPVSATTTNANNNFLVACAKNVDNTQVGAGGFFASQLLPTNSAQATFGGGQTYSFTNGAAFVGGVNIDSLVAGAAQVSGTFAASLLTAKSNGATSAYAPPAYSASGASLASTTHMVFASCATATTNCLVNLSGAAVFTAVGDYACGGSTDSGGGFLSANNNSASQVGVSFSSSRSQTGYIVCLGF